jgi:uncharacterized protein YbjT (DUF2867 family)
MILVTGVGGRVGRRVLDDLAAAGAAVRAGTTRPDGVPVPAGGSVVRLDLADPATMPAALDGIDGVFLYAEPRGAGPFVAAAEAAGVKRVVLLSSLGVERGDQSPITLRHSIVEDALRGSSMAWTFLRPGPFATNALRWAPTIKAEGVVRLPYPESHGAPIHEADIAAVAVTALLGDGHDGHVYQLSGPASLTLREQAEQIGEATGRPVRVEAVDPAVARAEMAKAVPEFVVDALLGMQAEADGVPQPVWKTVEEVSGQPARPFAQWAADHAADFV